MRIVNIQDGDPWPGGISDGLVTPCSICGKHTPFDYQVEDWAWETTIPREYQRGVVCLECFYHRAKQYGVKISDVLTEIQYTLDDETILLIPAMAFRYGGSGGE
jgi:hypothetical protein